jgi:hypothetical protein
MVVMGYTLVPLPPQRPDRLNVWIHEITSRRDLRRAAGLHRRINRGDSYWIAPPRGAIRRALEARYQADQERGAIGVFMAETHGGLQADQVIGTIAVWVAGESEEDLSARFGLFEVINEPEVAEGLIEAAEMWLLERFPAAAIRGPSSLDERQTPGLLTDGFNVRPAPGLPYNPPYYPEMIESAGYAPCQTARTYLLPARASSDQTHVRVSGEIGSSTRIIWEGQGEALDAIIVSPELSGVPLRLAERLLHPLASRQSPRRLLARPAGDGGRPGQSDRWLALCQATTGVAARLSYDEVLLGPISDGEGGFVAGLMALGARPAHTYQVFEKEF